MLILIANETPLGPERGITGSEARGSATGKATSVAISF